MPKINDFTEGKTLSKVASPLDGIKVLDFSQGISGGIATKMLAVMGAEVIKIESPQSGDISRSRGPFIDNIPHPEKSGQFLYLNMNKKGITLSLDNETGIDIATQLIEWADIIVENFLPGKMDEWGIGYSAIEQINSAKILVSLSPFGQTGPYKSYRGNDITAQSLGGLAFVTGDPSREPLQIGGEPAEYFCGLSGFSGALVASTYKEISGVGQHVDVSAQAGIGVAQMYSGLSYILTGKERGRRLASSPLYKTADGQVGITLRQTDWPGVCEMIGRPELEHDEKFKDMDAREKNQDEITALIAEWASDKKKQDLYHASQERGMTWGYICDAKDLIESPQYQHREYFVELAHPIAGKLTYPGLPMKWGGDQWNLKPAPTLGQHNEEVYGSLLGWDNEKINQMKNSGII